MYKQITSKLNEEYRFIHIKNIIQFYSKISGSIPSLLDVGAGLSPFKNFAEQTGWLYKSHDFSKYAPDTDMCQGLQSEAWPYPPHDFVCDILEIPGKEIADLVLCTEVFEHIPDPVRAFQKIVTLCKRNGIIVITVPFASLMHQAPYWFQSGLSPFWFEYWAEKYNIEILELTVFGDYYDVAYQEAKRIFGIKRGHLIYIFFRLIRKIYKKDDLRSSLGHGVIFIGKKHF
jgi:SAM-dependent methyltransferase